MNTGWGGSHDSYGYSDPEYDGYTPVREDEDVACDRLRDILDEDKQQEENVNGKDC